MVVAEPFGNNQNDCKGLFILNAGSVEEANKILETDPVIKAKLLEPEIYPWYGSAALSQFLKDSNKVWGKSFKISSNITFLAILAQSMSAAEYDPS